MTSKEALEKIKDFKIVVDNSDETYYSEYYLIKENYSKELEAIEKDLEILKILKKYFKLYTDDETENGLEDRVFSGIDLDDIWADGEDEDFNKIMEWLENDK